MTAHPPDLVYEMTYTVRTADPLDPTAGSQYWQVTEASLSGPRIRASISSTGIDWMRVSDDGFWRPDVHVQFRTEDGAIVLLHYTGLVEQTARFKGAADSNQPTGWEDQYMRLSMQFDTGDERYAWLNQHLFIAKGRLQGAGQIEYAVFRID